MELALLVTWPACFDLLRIWGLLMMEAYGVPARHDVESDDTAQGMGHNGHLPILLKLWVPRTEQRVETVQLQSQTSSDL